MFTSIIYVAAPKLLDYNFLFSASVITSLILGVYHAKYKKRSDIDAAIAADVEHVEEVIEEEIEEIEEKLHIK